MNFVANVPLGHPYALSCEFMHPIGVHKLLHLYVYLWLIAFRDRRYFDSNPFFLLSFSSIHHTFYTRLFIPVFCPFVLAVDRDRFWTSPSVATVIERFLVGLLASMEEALDRRLQGICILLWDSWKYQSSRFPLNRFHPPPLGSMWICLNLTDYIDKIASRDFGNHFLYNPSFSVSGSKGLIIGVSSVNFIKFHHFLFKLIELLLL